MERYPSRVPRDPTGSPLRRWRDAGLQARPPVVAVVVVGVALAAVATAGCAPPSASVRPRELPPRVAADTIVVRTDSFVFRTGVAVDPTWPAQAETTRAALGGALEVLLEDEGAVVPVVARELGVAWPEDRAAFDVALVEAGRGSDAVCAGGLASRLSVASGSRPVPFFACVLERALDRLADASALRRAIGGSAAREEGDALYGCIVRYAVTAALVAGHRPSRDDAASLDAGLAARCSPAMVSWASHAWLKRVREEEGAEAFGRRAWVEGRPLSESPPAPR
jgi:hypothetical protein